MFVSDKNLYVVNTFLTGLDWYSIKSQTDINLSQWKPKANAKALKSEEEKQTPFTFIL